MAVSQHFFLLRGVGVGERESGTHANTALPVRLERGGLLSLWWEHYQLAHLSIRKAETEALDMSGGRFCLCPKGRRSSEDMFG